MIATYNKDFAMANSQSFRDQRVLPTMLGQADLTSYTGNVSNGTISERSLTQFDVGPNTDSILGLTAAAVRSLPIPFPASNTCVKAYKPATVLPVGSRCDMDPASSRSLGECLSSQIHYFNPSSFATNNGNAAPRSPERHRDSFEPSYVALPPATPQAQMRRKRCLRSAEPATARATYLERNRKAAKKCRSKQRRQQEELVETARAMERQNKALKAEVESLQVRVLGLMQLIGQHADCLLTCLKINPRLQEPRLAPGNQREALPSLLPGDPYCRNNPAGQVTFPGKH
jgi:hypothetical protein